MTFVAGCDSVLHVIDTTTGKEEIKSVELDGQVGATPALVGDFLYVGTMTNQVHAINLKGRQDRLELRVQNKAAAVFRFGGRDRGPGDRRQPR